MGLKIDRKKNLIPKIIGWSLLVILVAGLTKIYFWENEYYHDKSTEHRKDSVEVLIDIEKVAAPEEDERTAEEIKKYQVEATSPRYLNIERLDLHARVLKSEANSISLPVPQNIFDTMWYSASARPGQNGVTVISGLAEGQNKEGAFKYLDSLEPGDKIQIQSGQGFEYNYEVKEVVIIPAAEVHNKLGLIQEKIDDKESLSLVTARKQDLNSSENAEDYDSVAIVRAILKDSNQTEQ